MFRLVRNSEYRRLKAKLDEAHQLIVDKNRRIKNLKTDIKSQKKAIARGEERLKKQKISFMTEIRRLKKQLKESKMKSRRLNGEL